MSKDEMKQEIIGEGMLNLHVCKRRYTGARNNPAKVFLPPGQAKQPTLLACAFKKKSLCIMWEGTEKKDGAEWTWNKFC